MPIPTFTSLPPNPQYEDVIAKINTIVGELQNLLLNLDTLNVTKLNAEVVEAGTITGDKIAAETITGTNIHGETITGDKVAANTITADRMDVTELSAITANLGTITAGLLQAVTIVGSLIQTAVSGTYPRVALSSDDNLFNAESSATNYIQIDPDDAGNPILYFVNGTITGLIKASSTLLAIQTLVGAGKIQLSSGDDLELFAASGKLVRFEDWNKMYSNGDTQTLQDALDALSARITTLGG